MSKLNLIVLSLLALTLAACSNVPQGQIGIKVEKYGDNKGVQNEVLSPGQYWLGWNTNLFLFPTYTITDKWTKSPDEGKAKDESLTFQIQGGIAVNTDISVAYHIESANASKLFQKYRTGIDEISDNALRNMVRDELNNVGITYGVEDLQGSGKTKLMQVVTENVRKKSEIIGISLESLSYINEFRFPPNVVAAINAKIQATQNAMKVENEVRQTKAEQEKEIVKADARIKVAEADAKSIELKGNAYKNNPQVLQLEIAKLNAQALENTKVQILGTMPTLFKDVSK